MEFGSLTAHDLLDVIEDEVHELVIAFEGSGDWAERG